MLRRPSYRVFGVRRTFSKSHIVLKQQGEPKKENPESFVVFGGTGFLGSRVVEYIRKELPNANIQVVSRRSKPSFALDGRMGHQKLDISQWDSVSRYMEDIDPDVVINCAGILNEDYNSFVEVMVEGTKNISHSAFQLRTPRLLHVGSLASSMGSRSFWADMKSRSEDMAYAAFPDATIIRPGLMFGKNDRIFNNWKKMATFMPVVPAPSSHVRMQPVWVDDVALGITKCSLDDSTKGKVFDFGGPDYYTMDQLVQATLEHSGKKRPVVKTGILFWESILAVKQFLPYSELSRDHILMLRNEWKEEHGKGWVLQNHAITDDNNSQFKDLNIVPKSLPEQMPHC